MARPGLAMVWPWPGQAMAKWRWGRSQRRRSGNPRDPRAHGPRHPQGTPGSSAMISTHTPPMVFVCIV